MADLIDDQTVALVGSAGNYAHGLIDPIEEIGRARALARHRPARRRLPRRLAAPLGRAPRLRRPALGLPRARRHLDLRRHAQVRLRAQGLQRPAVPRQGRCASASTSPSRPGPAVCTSRRASRARAAAASSPRPGPRCVSTGESGYLAAADAHHAHGDDDQGRHPRDPRARGDRRSALPRSPSRRRTTSTSTWSTTRSSPRAGA